MNISFSKYAGVMAKGSCREVAVDIYKEIDSY